MNKLNINKTNKATLELARKTAKINAKSEEAVFQGIIKQLRKDGMDVTDEVEMSLFDYIHNDFNCVKYK